MKKTKAVLTVLSCMFIFLSFCSCGFFTDPYQCDADAVESIQIVVLDDYIESEFRYEYKILCTIGDHAVFVERLNTLDQSVWWGDPRPMEEGCTVIKVEYLNGDYDLLYHDSQTGYRNGKNTTGFILFDQEQFEALISDYLNELEETQVIFSPF